MTETTQRAIAIFTGASGIVGLVTAAALNQVGALVLGAMLLGLGYLILPPASG